MRRTLFALLLIGCGDDSTVTGIDARVVDASLPVADANIRDARVIDAASGGAIDAAKAVDAPPPPIDANLAAFPQVKGVVITHHSPCHQGTSNLVDVEIVATDDNTAPANLIYSATSEHGCAGTINARVSTVNCPEAMPYPYTLTVTDTDSHKTTSGFSIVVCVNTPDAGP